MSAYPSRQVIGADFDETPAVSTLKASGYKIGSKHHSGWQWTGHRFSQVCLSLKSLDATRNSTFAIYQTRCSDFVSIGSRFGFDPS